MESRWECSGGCQLADSSTYYRNVWHLAHIHDTVAVVCSAICVCCQGSVLRKHHMYGDEDKTRMKLEVSVSMVKWKWFEVASHCIVTVKFHCEKKNVVLIEWTVLWWMRLCSDAIVHMYWKNIVMKKLWYNMASRCCSDTGPSREIKAKHSNVRWSKNLSNNNNNKSLIFYFMPWDILTARLPLFFLGGNIRMLDQ